MGVCVHFPFHIFWFVTCCWCWWCFLLKIKARETLRIFLLFTYWGKKLKLSPKLSTMIFATYGIRFSSSLPPSLSHSLPLSLPLSICLSISLFSCLKNDQNCSILTLGQLLLLLLLFTDVIMQNMNKLISNDHKITLEHIQTTSIRPATSQPPIILPRTHTHTHTQTSINIHQHI